MSIIRIPDENYPQKTIVLKDSVFHSYMGQYFLGQTDMIRYGGELQAWGGLFNPPNSMVNMFLNAYTISNFTDQPITAEGWIGGCFSGKVQTSSHFAAGNQSIFPPTQPMVLIQSASYASDSPMSGSYTFTRRVEASMTLTKHDFQGMYIIPPGSSFVLFFLPPGKKHVSVKIAFGWWEEELG